ncbi:unnamed protein product [Paramecium octaurelia]|uniref:Uncharacterized protein n=1 Tax=Paramecium octaurelia TaxID=43137 RepID=A0A8S1YL77_PAROT|nr:unnamed protein product [Paramecium octaurelia]
MAHLGFAQVKKNSYQMAMEKSILANLLILNFEYNLKMAFLRMMQEIKDQIAPQKKIIIIDFQTGLQVNNNDQLKSIKIYSSNVKVGANITINFFKGYLDLENIDDQQAASLMLIFCILISKVKKLYFSKKKINRQNINRILFLPTTLTTNFGRNCTDQHAKNIFEAELLQFQDLNYDLKKIYSQIGMPVTRKTIIGIFYFQIQNRIVPTDQMNVDQQLILAFEKLLKQSNLKSSSLVFLVSKLTVIHADIMFAHS